MTDITQTPPPTGTETSRIGTSVPSKGTASMDFAGMVTAAGNAGAMTVVKPTPADAALWQQAVTEGMGTTPNTPRL